MAYQSVLPRELTIRLHLLAKRLRVASFLAGCGRFGLATSGLLVGLMSADWLFDFEPTTRLSLLVVWSLVAITTAAWWLVRPWLKSMSDVDLAALAEQRFPELGERLTSLVELSNDNTPHSQRGSAFMREMLEQETLQCLTECDIEGAVPKRRAMRTFWSGTTAVVVLLLSFLLMPNFSGMLFARIFNPWGNFDSVSRLLFEIEDGDRVVARGSEITINAKVRWRNGSDDPVPEPITVQLRSQNGESDARDMSFNADVGAFQTTLSNVFDSYDFYVQASGGRSKHFHIEVVEPPSVTAAKLIVESPPYVGDPRREIDGVAGDVKVFERSRLKFELAFNKAVKSASIEWMSPSVVAGTQYARPKAKDDAESEDAESLRVAPRLNELVPAIEDLPRTELKLSADRRSASVEFVAEIQAVIAFRLIDEQGLENAEPHRQLLITLDQPPVLEVAGSAQDEARPDDIFPLRLNAVDDIGLGELELHLTGDGGLKQTIPLPSEKLGTTSLEHEFRIDLADLKLKSGDHLKIQVRAADERPTPSPNVVWSEPKRISIRSDASAPGSRDIVARQHDMQLDLKQIRQAIDAEIKKSDELKQVAQKNADESKSFQQTESLKALAEQEGATGKALQDLAERFKEHPLFANLAPEAKRLAEQELLKQAQQLQTSTKFEAGDLAEQLKDNSEALEAVKEKLAALDQRFGELAKLERELLDVSRLAQRANQLAEDAEQLEAKRQDLQNSPLLAGEREEDRAAAQEQLRQEQTQLGREQSELADALNKLLEQKPEIVDAARDHQLERLTQLAERARQLADRQEKLQQAVQAQARDAAQKAEQVTAREEELRKPLQELADKVKAQQIRNPVDPNRLETLLKELKDGNPPDAREAANDLAENLERLAEQLQKNAPLPEDPREAARELAKRQEALAKDIQAAADQAAKGEEPESLQRLAARELALETAASQLDVGTEARDEQQAAVDKAAESLKQLGEAMGNRSFDMPTSPEGLQQAAEKAHATTEALKQLAEAAQSNEQRKANAEQRAAQQRETQEAIAQLQKQQEALREQAEKLLSDPKNLKTPEELADSLRDAAPENPKDEPFRKLAEQERKLAEDIQKLETPQTPSAKKNAADAAADSAMRLNQAPVEDQTERLRQSLKQTEDALERLAEKSNQAEPTDPQAERQQLADEARELAQQQRELANELAAMNPEQPTGQQPTGQQPTGQQPTGQQPTGQQPTGQQPMGQQPMGQQPMGQQPMGQQPMGQQPMGQQPMGQQPTGQQPMRQQPMGQQPMGQQPMGQQPMGQQPMGDRPSASELAQQQRELAQEAAQLAQEIAQQAGEDSPAARAARQAQENSEEAAADARTGQFQAAQNEARQAASSAQQAAEATRESAPELAQRAQELANEQQQAADALGQAATDPAARNEAQRNEQRQLANQIQNLEQALNDAANQLGAAPLNAGEASEAARQAAQELGSSSQAQPGAQRNLAEGNSGSAANEMNDSASGLQGAQRSLEQAPQPSGQRRDIPGELANQLTQAAQRLEQARQQLGSQPGSQPGQSQPGGPEGTPLASSQGQPMGQSPTGQSPMGQPMNGTPSENGNAPSNSGNQERNPSGQPGQPGSNPGPQNGSQNGAQNGSAQGQNQPAGNRPGQPNQSGSSPNGNNANGSPNELAQATESLKQAAQQLSQAANQLQADGAQSGNRPRSVAPNQPQAANSPMSNSSGDQGNQGAGDLTAPTNGLQPQAQRNWGKLPGTLKTEILQSSQRKANGDYSKLIKLYFEELAKSGSKEQPM